MYRVLVFASLNKYIEKPFDREGSEKRISENNSRYPDVFFVISALPGIENKSFDIMIDQDVRYSLFLQIQAMWLKEQGDNG